MTDFTLWLFIFVLSGTIYMACILHRDNKRLFKEIDKFRQDYKPDFPPKGYDEDWVGCDDE